MAITKEIIQDKIEVVGDYKTIQVRTATDIKEDGVELSRSFHRHALDCVSSVKNDDDTWTPSFQSDGSTTYTTRVGTYTKVGDLVTAWFHIDINVNGATGTQSLIIAGIPFAAASTSENYGSISGLHCNQWSSSTKPDNALISPSANVAALYKSNGQTGIQIPTHNDIGGGNLLGCLIYKAS